MFLIKYLIIKLPKKNKRSQKHLLMNYTTISKIFQQSIENISINNDSIIIPIETKPSTQRCPSCYRFVNKIHGYRDQMIKEAIFHDKILYLKLHKRRYICSCGRTFFEHYDFIQKYQRYSKNFISDIMCSLSSFSSLKQLAKNHKVSSTTMIRYLNYISIMKPNKLPRVLGIDEFKGNTGGEKYNCILTDLETGKIFDILPNRKKSDLITYFRSYKNRSGVQYFVMDMTNNYKELSFLFPNAQVVVDRFHYVRQVYWALDNVRKRVQKGLRKEERLYFKHSKKLLFKEYSRLATDERRQVQLMISKSDDLYNAWVLKESFIDFRRSKTEEQATRELENWIETAKESLLQEFKSSITAFSNWFPYIINSIKSKLTNARTEGKNNKIKVLKRNAYGYRNFNNFKTRILLSC